MYDIFQGTNKISIHGECPKACKKTPEHLSAKYTHFSVQIKDFFREKLFCREAWVSLVWPLTLGLVFPGRQSCAQQLIACTQICDIRGPWQ